MTAVRLWEEKEGEGEGGGKIRSAVLATIGMREEGRTA